MGAPVAASANTSATSFARDRPAVGDRRCQHRARCALRSPVAIAADLDRGISPEVTPAISSTVAKSRCGRSRYRRRSRPPMPPPRIERAPLRPSPSGSLPQKVFRQPLGADDAGGAGSLSWSDRRSFGQRAEAADFHRRSQSPRAGNRGREVLPSGQSPASVSLVRKSSTRRYLSPPPLRMKVGVPGDVNCLAPSCTLATSASAVLVSARHRFALFQEIPRCLTKSISPVGPASVIKRAGSPAALSHPRRTSGPAPRLGEERFPDWRTVVRHREERSARRISPTKPSSDHRDRAGKRDIHSQLAGVDHFVQRVPQLSW